MRLLVAILILFALPAPADLATYYPNSANCTGVHYQTCTHPPTALVPTNSDYPWSDDDRNTASTDDDNAVGTGGGWCCDESFGFRVKMQIVENPAAITQLKWTFKGNGQGNYPSVSGQSVAVWDYSAVAWTNTQSGTASSRETFTITVTTNISHYISGGTAYLVCYQTAPVSQDGWAFFNLYYVKLEVTYSAAAPAVPQTVITTTSGDGQ